MDPTDQAARTRVLIVDDEAPARDRLQRMLTDLQEYQVIGEAMNATEALHLCQQLQPEIILLDIRMPGMSGLEVAQHLNHLPNPPAVIFTTAYEEHALEAFEAEAVGYLLKPIRSEKLLRTLQHATRLSTNRLQRLGNQLTHDPARTHLCVKQGDQLHLIPTTSITHFTAEQKYITVHHNAGTNLINESLKDLSIEFEGTFIRIHRNCLVNEQAIESIERDTDGQHKVKLRGSQQTLPISRRHCAAALLRIRGGHS